MFFQEFWKIWILQIGCVVSAIALTITNGYCQKNVSVKYQVPVTKLRPVHSYSQSSEDPAQLEQYVAYQDHIRWDTIKICCPGYRSIIFGFCQAICQEPCPPHSSCFEPNKCSCLRGYEPSHHTRQQHTLVCRPICVGGCPEHSHCVAHNQCDCRPGFKDVSLWFMPLNCERIPCGPEQRYDISRKSCIKIEMSMEELMRKVAEKLTKGLDVTDEPSAESDMIENK